MITLSSKKSKVNLSSKRGINLINHEDEKQKAANALLALLLIAVLGLAIAKFGVIDQMAKQTAAENEYNLVHDNYTKVMDSLARYKDVQSEYRQYSTEWLDKNEDGKYVSVSRLDVLNLIEKELMSKGNVQTIMIAGDTVDVVMNGLDLKDISTLCSNLEMNDIVAFATLTQGETENKEDKGGEVIEEVTDENGEVIEEVVVEEPVEDEKNGLTFNINITLFNPNSITTENTTEGEA